VVFDGDTIKAKCHDSEMKKEESMREEAKGLIEMVRKRVPDKEIMEKLGIQRRR